MLLLFQVPIMEMCDNKLDFCVVYKISYLILSLATTLAGKGEPWATAGIRRFPTKGEAMRGSHELNSGTRRLRRLGLGTLVF